MSAFDGSGSGAEVEMKNWDGFELVGKCFAWNEWRSDSVVVGMAKVIVDIVMTGENYGLPTRQQCLCQTEPRLQSPVDGCVIILVLASNAEGIISVCKDRDLSLIHI